MCFCLARVMVIGTRDYLNTMYEIGYKNPYSSYVSGNW